MTAHSPSPQHWKPPRGGKGRIVSTDSADAATPAASAAKTSQPSKGVRIIGIIIVVAGAILAGAGIGTWFTVQSQLKAEKIVVADDASMFAGKPVAGPFTAYAEAQIINEHALKATGDKTYAELSKDDPKRQTVMTASFLRASLFTSVVSFGIAAMAMGLGVLFILVGIALSMLGKQRS